MPDDYCALRLTWDTPPDQGRVLRYRELEQQQRAEPVYEGATTRTTWEQRQRTQLRVVRRRVS